MSEQATDRITIVGAGAVGLALAARLANAGVDVHLVTRQPAAAAALRDGLVVEDAASGEQHRVEVAAGTTPPGRGPILLCTIAHGVEDSARAIHAVAPGLPVVTFQNDVDNEARAARHLGHVIGGVWRQTCTRIGPARVRFQCATPARAILGLHPYGRSDAVESIATLLRRGEIDVGVSECIAEDKWLKLCVNLTSAPNALIRRSDHATEAFTRIKVLLLEEARAALDAAAIVARSCDGRDRSLDDEIAFHRGAHRRGTSARPIPLYNQVWSSLRHATPMEATAYHQRILDLAQRHGLDAPLNERVLRALEDAERDRKGPERLAAAALLG